MKLGHTSIKKLMVVIFSGVVALGIMSMCTRKVWVYTDPDGYNSVIISPDGVKYRFWDFDFYIVGLQSGKKAGTLLQEFKEGDKPLYYIKGADSDRYVVIKNTSSSLSMDPTYDFKIYAKADEGFEYDYRDANVSKAAFIPYGTITGNSSEFDYLSYLDKNGLFGDDAKAIMSGTLTERTDEEVFSDELSEWDFSLRFSDKCRYVGELVYSPEGVDWFAYLAIVYYNSDYGYFISIPRFSAADDYMLSDENATALGINKP